MSIKIPDPKRIEDLKNLGVLNNLLNENPNLSYKEVDEKLFKFLDLQNKSTKWFKRFILTLGLIGTFITGFQNMKKKYTNNNQPQPQPQPLNNQKIILKEQLEQKFKKQLDDQKIEFENRIKKLEKELEESFGNSIDENMEEKLPETLSRIDQILKRNKLLETQVYNLTIKNQELSKANQELSKTNHDLSKEKQILTKSNITLKYVILMCNPIIQRINSLFGKQILDIENDNNYFSQYELSDPFKTQDINKYFSHKGILNFSNITKAFVIFKDMEPKLSKEYQNFFITNLEKLYKIYINDNNPDKMPQFNEQWEKIKTNLLKEDDNNIFDIFINKKKSSQDQKNSESPSNSKTPRMMKSTILLPEKPQTTNKQTIHISTFKNVPLLQTDLEQPLTPLRSPNPIMTSESIGTGTGTGTSTSTSILRQRKNKL